jgi:hypothetical protein
VLYLGSLNKATTHRFIHISRLGNHAQSATH